MLKKLLKYDLKSVFKYLSFFYLLTLVFGVLTRILLSIDNSFIIGVIGNISSLIVIVLLLSIIINNIMRLWMRFKSNLYGDESYLMHTLPVKKKELYLSKFICSVISLLVSMVVVVLVLFITYYSEDNLNFIREMLDSIVVLYDSNISTFIGIVVVVFFLEMLNLLQAGYTGIILGHRMNSGKIGYSVLFGYLVYMATQIFVLMIVFIVALFNKDLLNLFVTNSVVELGLFKFIMYMCLIVYLLSVGIVYLINVKLFGKGVNVD